MRLLTGILLGCAMTLLMVMGGTLVVLSVHGIPMEGAVQWIQMMYQEHNLNFRIMLFLAGLGMIIINAMIANLILTKFQRQKTIAFENPDGQVTVSLSAIEDFIRRAARELEDVKDLRADVVAKKGRIIIRARATLWSDAHIPEVTERIQFLVKTRVQEMLSGVEEPITVRVHVAKITHREEAHNSPPPRRSEQIQTPFRGF